MQALHLNIRQAAAGHDALVAVTVAVLPARSSCSPRSRCAIAGFTAITPVRTAAKPDG
jgi:hypothetical protein